MNDDRPHATESIDEEHMGNSRRSAPTLSLSDKGPIAPPPVLRQPLERLSNTVQSWPDIIAATHWNLWRKTDVDGVDFYRGEDELGHIHLDGELHLAIPQKIAYHLIQGALAKKFPYGSDWVMLRIASDDEVRSAEWLMRLAYDLLGGATVDNILARCDRRQQTGG